jgi:cell wall-associated NlpC family hydrolase
VGIYIGNGDFIHASSYRGGVVISTMETGSYNRNFVCARRLF